MNASLAMPVVAPTPAASSSDDGFSILRSIMEASQSFAYRCDNDEDVTMRYLTGSVEGITGCRADDLLGNKTRTYASLCHADDLRPMIDQVDVAIAERRPWDLDYRLVRPDGSEILVRERGVAVRNAADEVIYLQGLVADATEERNLRLQLEENMQATVDANAKTLDLAEKIVKSVRELSILAINARIEAARAGDAGRGFDVVATEIGALAHANAAWAREIAELLSVETGPHSS